MKRKVIVSVASAWGFAGLAVITTIIEPKVSPDWQVITNGIWVLAMFSSALFIIRGFYYLSKYVKGRNDETT